MNGDEIEDVENRYKVELQDALPKVREQAAACRTAFERVTRALENGAWQSTAQQAFEEELRARKDGAEAAGDDCQAAFENAEAAEPDKVPDDDWRARFDPYPRYGYQ